MNLSNDATGVVSLIESGQADKMLEKGRCKVNHEIRGQERRVLVSKYEIAGETYRIEVRRQVHPMRNILRSRLRTVTYKKGRTKSYVSKAKKIYDCLEEHSFEAQPEIAYRAWKGLDGKLRPIEIYPAPRYEWISNDDDMNLYIRTKEWPIPVVWIRGMTSDGRSNPVGGENDFLNYNLTTGAMGSESQETRACDGRWTIESPGPGAGCVDFVNLELYDIVMNQSSRDHLNSLSISNGTTAVTEAEDARRRIDMLNDIQERTIQDDWNWFWLQDQASYLNKWQMKIPR